MEDTTIIIIHDDRMWKSIVSDVVSFSSLVIVVLVGVFLESTALQWIGGILWIIAFLTRLGAARKEACCTIEQARNRLDILEAKEK